MRSNVWIELEGVPLKTSLGLLLKQLNLEYIVKSGQVFISTTDRVRQRRAGRGN
jgi:hypothetical protein